MRGSTPPEAPPVLVRRGIDAAIFGVQVREFGKLFCNVAVKPKSVSEARSLKSGRRFYQRSHRLPKIAKIVGDSFSEALSKWLGKQTWLVRL